MRMTEPASVCNAARCTQSWAPFLRSLGTSPSGILGLVHCEVGSKILEEVLDLVLLDPVSRGTSTGPRQTARQLIMCGHNNAPSGVS